MQFLQDNSEHACDCFSSFDAGFRVSFGNVFFLWKDLQKAFLTLETSLYQKPLMLTIKMRVSNVSYSSKGQTKFDMTHMRMHGFTKSVLKSGMTDGLCNESLEKVIVFSISVHVLNSFLVNSVHVGRAHLWFFVFFLMELQK